jgi:hypothetical protein
MRTLVILLVLASLAGVASADDFDMVASGCTPDRRTLHPVNDTVVNGAVKNSTGGVVQLNCMVPLIDPPSHLYLLYAQTASGMVSAAYCKLDKWTWTSNCSLATAYGTNTNGAVGWVEVPFTDTYDPHRYYYWVVVGVSRSSPTESNGNPTVATFYQATLW